MQFGKFIVLEGLDGSGKTTLLNSLKKYFPDFLYTREPGGTVFGEKLRKILLDEESKNVPPLATLLAFVAARASHYHELVLPALLAGRNVVSDRFDASTFAFQICQLDEKERGRLTDTFFSLRKTLLETEYGLSVKPYYIYLRLEVDSAEKRRQNRLVGENHFDRQGSDYHERVFNGYEMFFRYMIDASEQMIFPSEHGVFTVNADLTQEDVFDKVSSYIREMT